MKQLTTARLTGRRLTRNDWSFFCHLYQDRQVMRFITDPLSEAEIRERFTLRLADWDRHSSHWLCLLLSEGEQGRPVGLTGRCMTDPGIAEAGFILSREGQGKGYGSESLHALSSAFFGGGYGHRLFCRVTEGNTPCVRLMERCGFHYEGCLRQSFWLDGGWRNDLLFSRLSSDPKVPETAAGRWSV
ncbi:GNAT family N-acetyltransferase [Tatumella citrea]|uniref:N-acetyltransferase domain-containing protein n=1 Tax=Tatumella citrea TaxID=53336 RepID=A0A1Y0LG92_TATCI|nr:GNAT family protein [Tatumella citrea]ARU93065.1 hypothetical protein A7K98_04170 [Tatumella citrea]ARU97103.1 hypothetical protein A7K99_04170 [Tatumella citrea]